MTSLMQESSAPAMSLRACRGLIVLVVAVVFGRLLLCDFTWWDDPHTVHQNPLMNPVSRDTFWFYWTSSAANIYIPLTYSLWALVSVIAQVSPDADRIALNPIFFHATNVIVHTAAAVGVFELLRRLCADRRAALCGALLFAVHPTQVESVAWISGLKDVLAGAITIATLIFFVVWRQNVSAPEVALQVSRRGALVGMFVCFVLAMLSKPSAMTTPLLVIALDVIVFRTPWKNALRLFGILLTVTLPFAWIARSVQMESNLDSPLWARPLVVMDSVAFYIVKIVFPITLSLDYTRSPMNVIRSGAIFYTWVLPVSIVAILWWQWRRLIARPLVLCGAVMFVAAPLHVLGLTKFDFQQYSTVSDHYLYVALVGAGAVACALLAGAQRRTFYLAGVVLGIFGARAAVHTPVWQSERTLMTHTQSVRPDSTLANIQLAALAVTDGDYALREKLLLRAVEKDDRNFHAMRHLARTMLILERYDEAPMWYTRIVSVYEKQFGVGHTRVADAYVLAVSDYLDIKRFDDADEYLARAAALDANNSDVIRLRTQVAKDRAKDRAKAHANQSATQSATQQSTQPTTRHAPIEAPIFSEPRGGR